MTTKEINARLSSMTAADIATVNGMIAEGYGARGIMNNTRFTLKQVNAVFAANAAK